METIGHVYKYSHNITGKWYIGSHNGSNPHYEGSGIVWKFAKNKYGIESFKKEILYEGKYFREVEEIILTALDAANDKHSYNVKNESLGGAFYGSSNGMFGRILTPIERYKCGNAFRGKKRPEHSIKMQGSRNPMYGKNEHTHGLRNRAQENLGKTYEEIFGEHKAAKIKAEMSKNRLGKPHNLIKRSCPHCGKVGSGPNMTRYHFDKCKDKNDSVCNSKL